MSSKELKKVIDNAYQVLAVEMLALIQAIDFLGNAVDEADDRLGNLIARCCLAGKY